MHQLFTHNTQPVSKCRREDKACISAQVNITLSKIDPWRTQQTVIHTGLAASVHETNVDFQTVYSSEKNLLWKSENLNKLTVEGCTMTLVEG